MTQLTAEPMPRPVTQRSRRLSSWLIGTVAGIVTIAVVVAWLGVWTVTRSFPQTMGTLQTPGPGQPVMVQRDAAGIPTITAESSHDLSYAQGLVHAQGRFWEMDFRRHPTSARLSELFDESQLGTEKFHPGHPHVGPS